jgi:hypothetical protein
LGRQLHDRATRGETLSADEQRLLEEWCREEDKVEAPALQSRETHSLPELRAQVDAVLAQLAVVPRRLQDIAAENEALRRVRCDH